MRDMQSDPEIAQNDTHCRCSRKLWVCVVPVWTQRPLSYDDGGVYLARNILGTREVHIACRERRISGVDGFEKE